MYLPVLYIVFVDPIEARLEKMTYYDFLSCTSTAVLTFISSVQKRSCIIVERSLLPTGRNDHYCTFQRPDNGQALFHASYSRFQGASPAAE